MVLGSDTFKRLLFGEPKKKGGNKPSKIAFAEEDVIEKVIASKSTPIRSQTPVIIPGDPLPAPKAPAAITPIETPPSLDNATYPFFIPDKNLSTYATQLSSSPTPPAVPLGTDVEKGGAVTIGDLERCGGLYVLGQPRTSKSTLLISLALSDIKRGYGILFIDPHIDAINALLARIPESRRKDIVFLDPTHESRSFGINLLHCNDPKDIDQTWGRIRDIFLKLWEQERGQLGFWLDKILKNLVYLLLDNNLQNNPKYTMIELPLLLHKDTTFRNSLLEKVKHKPFVKDFWYEEFDTLSPRDRREQVDSTLNRPSMFRDIDVLRESVGQNKFSVDFRTIMKEGRIVLLRLPANLTGDTRVCE
jgi:hypothetical protein